MAKKKKISDEMRALTMGELLDMFDNYNNFKSGSCTITLWSDGSNEINDPMITGRKIDQIIFGSDTLEELVQELKNG